MKKIIILIIISFICFNCKKQEPLFCWRCFQEWNKIESDTVKIENGQCITLVQDSIRETYFCYFTKEQIDLLCLKYQRSNMKCSKYSKYFILINDSSSGLSSHL